MSSGAVMVRSVYNGRGHDPPGDPLMSASQATRRSRKLPPGIEPVHRRDRSGRGYTVYRVRYRDAAGERRSKTFDTVDDASDFRSKVRLAERSGELAELDAGTETLDIFTQEYVDRWGAGNLSSRTLTKYIALYNRHAAPRLGSMPLRAITPSVVEDFARELEQAQVGPEARRAVLVTLQSIFRRAVVWDRVRSNPIAAVRKPGGRRVKAIVPLAPATVEAIRAELVAESDARSAVLVSLLAYAGLRPEEALALRWRHVRERTLLVDSKNVDGELLDGQKVTGKPPRTVDLLAPLKADLLEWGLASGRPADEALVIPGVDGEPWTESAYKSWGRRGGRGRKRPDGKRNGRGGSSPAPPTRSARRRRRRTRCGTRSPRC
jgi:integrase